MSLLSVENLEVLFNTDDGVITAVDKIGFELEEYVLWNRVHEYNNCRPLGYPFVYRFNKVHEYICIYWKR